MNRRSFISAGSALLLRPSFMSFRRDAMRPNAPVPIFDGSTLNGWTQFENSSISFSSAAICDPAGLVKRIIGAADPVSASILASLTDEQRNVLTTDGSATPEAKLLTSTLTKILNQQISGAPLNSQNAVRSETQLLLAQKPTGVDLLRANKLILEDTYPVELARSSATGWVVKDGAMTSTGSGRGVIYTAADYSRFRLTFTMRHVSGKPDHQACVLIFCTRPQPGSTPLDALGGIQFQVPNGGHWDYRVGMNQGGGAEFTTVQRSTFDIHAWSGIEILADASRGTARMAVAQPPGSKAIEVLDFRDPTAGRAGPIALQMHNAGLFDEYKDLLMEINPERDELITTKY